MDASLEEGVSGCKKICFNLSTLSGKKGGIHPVLFRVLGVDTDGNLPRLNILFRIEIYVVTPEHVNFVGCGIQPLGYDPIRILAAASF